MPILWTDQQPQHGSEQRIRCPGCGSTIVLGWQRYTRKDRRNMNRIYIARSEYSIVDVIAWLAIAGFAGAWIGVEIVIHVVGR